MARQQLDYRILDAIAFDAERHDDIVKYLNDPATSWRAEHGPPIQPAEVHAALVRLVNDGMIEVHLIDYEKDDFVGVGERIWPPKQLAEMYFDLTGRGRLLYLNWDD
ncbi:MAG: hypothetical protein ABI647_15500 [Gemmatimonadota bacterium]